MGLRDILLDAVSQFFLGQERLKPGPLAKAPTLDPAELVTSFLEAARLAGVEVKPRQVWAEIVKAPHRRPSLPHGKQAVYGFLVGDVCLKVGKAGPSSAARFTSQHYGGKAPSTLAKSIIDKREPLLTLVPEKERSNVEALTIETVGQWLQENTSRLHLFLPAAASPHALSLAEAFVQCRLDPIYEGWRTQRGK